MTVFDSATFAAADLTAIGVFAATGALVASRKQMDLVSFGMVACMTGVGGGTLRDLLLGRPVFWVVDPKPVLVCLAVALLVFFTAPAFRRRYPVLLWADGVGVALYGVMGAEVARQSGADFLVAVMMGMMTATFGGLIRDVMCRETPLILKREIYATCAALAAAGHMVLLEVGLPLPWAAAGGFVAGFGLRAGGLIRGWSLPGYKARPGRDY
ncbi:MAG: trimeric intracellular cation channel family protein [Pseudomonadota bacterium]